MWLKGDVRCIGFQVSKATIYRRMKDPVNPFPKPYYPFGNDHIACWSASEVEAWISAVIAADGRNAAPRMAGEKVA
jgi:predicted DNA-binding transcriptional regulator AlpA